MRRAWIEKSIPPAALLAACLLAFGITIPWLGLYADDWPFAYANHAAGLRGVVDFISWVRPVAAWVFAAASALVGTHFWAAHVLLLVLRWAASVLFWLVLRRAWPSAPRLALWAALLFAVYPAFKQSPLALEYTPHFLALILLFASLWASLRLAEMGVPLAQSWPLAIAAWLGSWQVFILEYFVGLEILRPALLWVVYSRREPARPALRHALRDWLPFLPVLMAFLLWRVFVVGFPSYQPELVSGLGAAPLTALINLGQNVLGDIWTAGVLAWVQPFTSIPNGGRTLLLWGGVISAGLLGMIPGLVVANWRADLDLDHPRVEAAASTRFVSLGFILVGLLAMLAAGWPFWITHIPLQLVFPWDRTSLAFMTGSCLLASGVLGLAQSLVEQTRQRWLGQLPSLALALLLAFSIGLHFQNANAFRKEGALLTNFFWQLTWRAPGLEPGTSLILDQPPFNYHVDKFLSPQLNWIYAGDSVAPDSDGEIRTPYGLFDFHKLWGNRLPPKVSNAPLNTRYGTLRFDSGVEKMLVVVYAPPGCLRVLTAGESSHLLMSSELKQTLPYSNLKMIQANPSSPAQPPDFLGAEPAHDWCYSFEKADLALQRGDYTEAARLADEAFAAGFAPKQPSEYLPIVYAYAQLGRWEDAMRRSQDAAANDFYRHAACTTWERIGKEIDHGKAEKAMAVLGCE